MNRLPSSNLWPLVPSGVYGARGSRKAAAASSPIGMAVHHEDGSDDDGAATVSTASSSSSVEHLVSNGIDRAPYSDEGPSSIADASGHATHRGSQHYHDGQAAEVCRYGTRHSSDGKTGRVRGQRKDGYGSYKDADNDDEEEEGGEDDDKELLDEEQRVGMMMQARDGRAPPRRLAKWSRDILPFADSPRSKLAARCGPCLMLIALALSLATLIPLLKWLSSASSRTEYDAQRASALTSKPHHLTEVTMPEYWRLPDAPRATGHFHKPKRPLPAGVSKLTAFNGPFALEYQVPPVPSPAGAKGVKNEITMDDVLGGMFRAGTTKLQWCAEDPDEGVFVDQDETGSIVLEDVTHLKHALTGEGEVAKGGGKVVLARGEDFNSEDGRRILPADFKISPDLKYVLLFSDKKSQWRYSSLSKVWLHNVAAKKTIQIGHNKTASTIAAAEWSKKGYVSFVEDNNLYIIKDPGSPSMSTVAVTNDGAKDNFNAVPDWVYEEEIFSGDTAHWWSPEGNRVVYLSFNESAVQEFSLPIYNPTEESEHALIYPKYRKIKYPKAGTPNPTVSVSVYDMTTSSKLELTAPRASTIKTAATVEEQTADLAISSAGKDVLITEVKWVNDHTLMLRETNRVSDAMRWLAFDCNKAASGSVTGDLARRISTTSTGWVPADQDAHKIGSSPTSTAYVNLITEPHGYRHVAYFRNATQSKPIYLTAGEWEVAEILFVGNGRVYFSAAFPRPYVRHILYVDIPNEATLKDLKPATNPASLTNTKEHAWYEADFDPKGGYYQLLYEGPQIPWSRVYSLRHDKFDFLLEDNAVLSNRVAKYVQPQRVFYNITTADGIVLSAQEIRPHDFDPSGLTRYPALVKVYGGPDSQIVEAKWAMADWATYLACTLGYIVVLVDGRGTGFRGSKYRDVVAWRLGDAEATDVVGAAEALRRLPYIAQSKVGIWGWSFGGYLTAKAIEKDSGTFDLGMSVAPVTRWEFYDSIYTERYMKTPALNKFGYTSSGVHVTKGFENSHFLLAQGSGDDNVHYQNSAHLLDMLTQQRIRGFWFRMFTDSSHSIATRGAYRELHEFMTRFLVYNWGAGGQRVFRYAKDKGDIS